MKIITRRERIERVSYSLCWQSLDPRTSSGFGFDCDEQGNVDESKLAPAGLENYRKCREGDMVGYLFTGVEKRVSYYTQPAVGECHCGQPVVLDGFTNTCECGTDYNGSGQRLASREQWGEETGEHPTDILNIR